MSEEARALLDSLMGPSRDKSREENLKADGWKEKNVCKRYLVGFCPNSAQDNWFHNTRRKDINVCTKIHSDRLRDDFLKHEDREKYEPEYEKDFLDFLEGLVREADAWIARENANCAAPGRKTKMPSHVKEKLAKLKMQSDLLFKRAEEAADANDLAGSKSAVDLAGIVNKEIEELKQSHTVETQGEQVCDICGVRCNPDEKADFEAHLAGRLHEGYTQIRAKVKELREKVRNQHARREADRKEGKEREKEGKDGKERDGDVGRERRRAGSREKADRRRSPRERKDRSRKRSKSKGRDRERRRDRSRSRSRRRR